MPVETAGAIGLGKLLTIVFGPLLALLAAAFGFMHKRQDNHIRSTDNSVSEIRTELYRDYVSKEYLEMYVTLVIRPVVESVDRLTESNRELAAELREQRIKR